MPKINVYLSEELAEAVRDAQVPVSAICQSALERAVREVSAARASDTPPSEKDDPAYGPFSRFTPRARKAVELGQQQARSRKHPATGTEHLLIGVIDEGTNLALKVLASLDVEPNDVRDEIVGSLGAAGKKTPKEVPFSAPAKAALEAATKESLSLAHNYIGCEHLLLGLIATDEAGAGQVLRRMGIERVTTRRAVITALTGLVHGRAIPATPAAQPTLADILRRLEAIEQRLAS